MGKIISLSQVSAKSVHQVGGKAASLGELMAQGVRVPSGFVVTTEAYRQGMSQELETEIVSAFERLGAERVAVRSSAVGEDSAEASWAGQLETYLNVNKDGLIDAIRKCWQSINSAHATEYAQQHKLAKADQAVAVVVQSMVDSEVSGVLFTANPVTNDRNQIVIEAVYGLGELLVQGSVTPENWVIDKTSSQVIDQSPGQQQTKLVYQNGKNSEVTVPTDQFAQSTLSQEYTRQLLAAGTKIEQHYDTPQDIEWAITGGKLYILQSRPITTIR